MSPRDSTAPAIRKIRESLQEKMGDPQAAAEKSKREARVDEATKKAAGRLPATQALRKEVADADSRAMVFGSDRTSPKRYPSSGLPKTKFE